MTTTFSCPSHLFVVSDKTNPFYSSCIHCGLGFNSYKQALHEKNAEALKHGREKARLRELHVCTYASKDSTKCMDVTCKREKKGQ